MQARRKELSDAVTVYGKLNRQELFIKSKSLDLGFGVIGFRASTKIVQMRGVTAEMTLLVGLKRQQSDTFFIEIKKEEVPETV